MHNLVGDLYTQIVSKTKELSGQFFRVTLRNKRLAYVPDMEERLSEFGLVKQLTGGDKQASDVKFGEYVSFETTAKFVMAMNQLPDFGDSRNLDPLARRVIILNFNYSLKKSDIDPDIEKKFAKEMPGIFNQAVNGLKRLQKQKDFTDTEKGKKILDELINKNKIVDHWLNENLIFDEREVANPEKSTHLFRLWESYFFYLESNYPNWRSMKYLEINNSNSLIKYLKKKFPKYRSIKKSANLENYVDPVSKQIKPKVGGYTAFGGLRFMNEVERDEYYRREWSDEKS
jgi:phage/plasmid-associated DNA primase